MSSPKKIAIVGAGFAGLSAAWDLVNAGHAVTVFEASKLPGGLASGFTAQGWEWSLEKHYHHVFETDLDIQKIMKEMGLDHLSFFRDTRSLVQYNGQRYQLDSPLSLLKFQPISLVSRMRTGAVLAFLKLFPYGQYLERFGAQDFLISTMGQESWKVIWEPLFLGKFGSHSKKINAAWFWARIYARSKQLGYFQGGFLGLAQQMVKALEDKGVVFFFDQPVSKIEKKAARFKLKFQNTKIAEKLFDTVVIAAPSGIVAKVVPDLPAQYKKRITQLKGLAAITLVLELNKNFFDDETYWLNINEKDWPFLAVVEHTNFVDKKHYQNKNLLYVGKYLEYTSQQFSMSEDELLDLYLPFLNKISKIAKKDIKRKWLFKEFFAQPIVEKNHSALLPKMTTPFQNLFWTSMQHVYPWDRGVNFAVKIGRELAKMIQAESSKKS